MPEKNGFLLIDKPLGWTSFDVVAKLRSLSGQKKIGHAGTLDPLASGLLIVAMGQARFLIEHVQNFAKTYEAQIKLGQTSSTDDNEGQKSKTFAGPSPTEKAVSLVLAEFMGDLKQIPPSYSALKIKGQKMYQLARQGLAINKKPRSITIYRLKKIKYEYPYLELKTEVSKGTYIRALARDVGRELKTGAFLSKLTRTGIGPFKLEDALSIKELRNQKITEHLIGPELVVRNMPSIVLKPEQLERLAQGQELSAPAKISLLPDQTELAIVSAAGQLLILARHNASNKSIKSKKIFDISLRR